MHQPGKEELCVIKKAEPHEFDHLLHTADFARLKTFVSIDWRRAHGDGKAPAAEIPYDFSTDKFIAPIESAAALAAAVDAHGAVIVDLYQPWCSQCAALQLAFVETARRIVANKELAQRGAAPLFARVDVRENIDIAVKYNVTCGGGLLGQSGGSMSPCGLAVFQAGVADPVVVHQKATPDDLFQALKVYVGEAVQVLEDADELADFKKSAPVVVVGVFNGDDEHFKAFKAAASASRLPVPAAAVLSSDLAATISEAKAPALVLFKPAKDGGSAVWKKLYVCLAVG